LREQVDAGHIVPKFGEKADEILSSMDQPDAQRVVDGALHALFLRQVALLRQQVALKFEGAGGELDALSQADAQFVQDAQTLLRQGSGWSFEPERGALRSWLHGAFQRDAALAEERARAALAQQATIEVISKLQDQMELLQQKAQSLRSGGSPWVLSTSYRIPNTPLQLVGRYEQGRANVELNLTPTKDPSSSDASFVESLGPANFGVSFNLGL